jgi:uncharacterized protein YpmB
MRKKKLILVGILIFAVILTISLFARMHHVDKTEKNRDLIKAAKGTYARLSLVV